MVHAKRVAIVGAGLAGIGSIKALKEESIEPVCFEKSSEWGGTWRYREEVADGQASLMWTTTINQSKEMGSISNYPFPRESPNYMRHFEVYEHFQKMAERFDLLRHVIYNTEVISVRKAEDYEETGMWEVTVSNTESGEVKTDTFDGVMVCVGHINKPVIPDFPGIEKFQGTIMHSHSVKRAYPFTGQKVVIVGTGCSALDAAAEISSVARQVYLSVRRPSWIISRLGRNGLPIDYILLRRYLNFFMQILPIRLTSKIIEHYFLDVHFNHKLYGIEPEYPVLCKDPTVNDFIGSKILSGAVALRKNIEHFVEDGVLFEGETATTQVDTVIMATGYSYSFPFLEEGTIPIEGDKIYLYKLMYPPHLKHPTLAIIGFALPFGPGFPIGELQTRVAAHLMSGKKSLPSRKSMMAEIKRRHKANVRRYAPQPKMTLRVDFIPYMDELASGIGAKPNFWKMFFTDPRLFIACVFGPCVSYQYRLTGPHKWDGAREAILKTPERMQAGICGTVKASCAKSARNFFVGHVYIFLLLILITIFVVQFFISWKDFAICSFVFYVATVLLLIVRNLGSVVANRYLWW